MKHQILKNQFITTAPILERLATHDLSNQQKDNCSSINPKNRRVKRITILLVIHTKQKLNPHNGSLRIYL